MSKYGDLELSILSCLLIRPRLMDTIDIEDKYFVKHRRIWIFMKTFYKRFGNFDIDLMYSITNSKYQLMQYITRILEIEASPSLIEAYIKQLKNLYNESNKDKWIIEKVFELANELYVRAIEPGQFKEKVDKVYENAERIFEEE